MTRDTDPAGFAVQLAEARARSGLSQRQVGVALAEHGGERVSGSAVGEWERGTSTPGLRNARALDRLFGEPFSEMLGYSGELPLLQERVSRIEEQLELLVGLVQELTGRSPGDSGSRRRPQRG